MKRFWNKVDKTNNCWLWIASTRTGYGAFKYKGKTYGTHQFVWFLIYGYFPKKWILHTCDNRRCVNPKHLFEGTARDNALDATKKGRMDMSHIAEGSKGHIAINRKLTFEESQFIIKEYIETGLSQRKIAKQYKINEKAVRYILEGKTYQK